jgi:hypothetical protein
MATLGKSGHGTLFLASKFWDGDTKEHASRPSTPTMVDARRSEFQVALEMSGLIEAEASDTVEEIWNLDPN